MLTSPTLSWFIAAVAGVLAILFLAGKGRPVLEIFSSRSERMNPKKRSAENERKYQRVIGFYLLGLAGCEVLMALFAGKTRWVPLLLIAVVIGGLIITGIALRKYQ